MDLASIAHALGGVRAHIPDDAFTADGLGTRREGSGVVLREDGLVLTIGYLITEAEEVWLTTHAGRVVPAHVLAYDQESGFGLLQALDRLDLPALELGSSAEAKVGDVVLAVKGETVSTLAELYRQVRSLGAAIVAKQEFAGYWEYLLDEAIFIAPAHPSWGGAALLSAAGALLGVGSLRLQMSRGAEAVDINMIVPIDLLPPILDDMMTRGAVQRPPRPWLGVFSAESNGEVIVMSVAEGGPAANAGIREGDVISDVRDAEVESLADFYRKVWGSGPAGAEVPLRIVRDGRETWLRVKSADRNSFLRRPQLQ
jgi:S1-C subfamily serine protease